MQTSVWLMGDFGLFLQDRLAGDNAGELHRLAAY